MSNINTGGPAFPTGTAFQGMTLRDYLAAHAPKHDEQWERDYCRKRGYMSEAKMIADWNYEYADEMLKARGK